MMKTNRLLTIATLSLSIMGGFLGAANAAPASKELNSSTAKRSEHRMKGTNPNRQEPTSKPIYKKIHG